MSQPSNQATVTTQADTSPPTAPGTPAATSVTSSQVGLAWTAATDNVGVEGYLVVRNGSAIAAVPGTSYTDSTVAAGTSYSYQIVAFDVAGNTTLSGTRAVTTLAPNSVFFDGFETAF